MAFVHGRNTYVSLSATDLSAFTSSSQTEKSADTSDTTTYGQSAHTFVGGLLNGQGSMSGIYDSSTSAGPRALIEPLIGQTVTWVIRPEGTGTGKPARSVSVIPTKYTETNPVADMVTWAVDMQFTGVITNSTQT